jgi:hypothetical protein
LGHAGDIDLVAKWSHFQKKHIPFQNLIGFKGQFRLLRSVLFWKAKTTSENVSDLRQLCRESDFAELATWKTARVMFPQMLFNMQKVIVSMIRRPFG